MKKIIAVLCAVMLCIGLAACGEKTDDTSSPETVHVSDKYFANSYWTAVQFIPAYPLGDGEPVLNVDLYADIIFYPDGNAKFHYVSNGVYVEGYEDYAECEWSYDETVNELTFSVPDFGESLKIDYDPDGICLLFTDENGDKLLFENNIEFPSNGEEFCAADLAGSWELLTHTVDDCEFDAELLGLSGAVSFFATEDGLTVNFVNTDNDGNELSLWDRPVMVQQCAMYEGCVNEAWTVMFMPDESDTFAKNEYYGTMLDENTLQIMIFACSESGEYDVYYQTYGR